MSDEQSNEAELPTVQVDTFRAAPVDESSNGEEGSGEEEEEGEEESGCLQVSYSVNDITEALVNDGGTLGKNVEQCFETGAAEPIYVNFPYRENAVMDSPYVGDSYLDLGFSSSEFDDSEEDDYEMLGGGVAPSGPKSFNFLSSRKKKKALPEKPSSVLPSGSSEKIRQSRTKAFLEKISKLGPRKCGNEGGERAGEQEPDEDLAPLDFGVGKRPFLPARLPDPAPGDLDEVGRKRRMVVQEIMESETNYLFALKRLVEEYQLPLMQSQPPIIPQKHVKVIFHKVRDIIQCHLLFHGELIGVAEMWDISQKIGDVFVASFSKSMVFEAYSSFVNNFSTAMDRAKKQARLKPTFGAFLKKKLDTSKDKLSLFGLMVKPVQRFPQFILLIQDLLKHTPKDHPDRLSLQWALTELEMLTDRLNETKKECESIMEAKRLVKAMSLGGFAWRSDSRSLFIRQDDVIQHKSREGATENKTKRLFLLSDQLVCAAVSKQKEQIDSNGVVSSGGGGEKIVVTWSAPVKDIEVVDPTLPSFKGNPLSRPSFSSASSGSSSGSNTGQKKQSRSIGSPAATPTWNPYWKDVDNMLHDIKVLEEMREVHAQLRLKYDALPIELFSSQIHSLEMLIRQKIDIDKNIVMLSIPTRSYYLMDGVSNIVSSMSSSLTEQISGRGKKTVTMEFPSLTMKHDWLIDLQGAKLATDPVNFPAWFLSENDPLSSRNPRFMTALKMDIITKEEKKITLKPKKKTKDELNCCTYVTLPCHNKPGSGIVHLWVCTGGRAAVVSLHTNQPFVVECFPVADGNIVVAERIPPQQTSDRGGVGTGGDEGEEKGRKKEEGEVVWMVSDDNRIYTMATLQKDRQLLDKPRRVEGAQVRCMKYFGDKVYLGTVDGTLIIYSRNEKGEWNFSSPQRLPLGKGAVTFLLVSDDDDTLWASCLSTVHILESLAGPEPSLVRVKVSHSLETEDDNPMHSKTSDSFSSSSSSSSTPSPSVIECMVKAGVGLLVSFLGRSHIRLFHAETFQHLQDINVSSAVSQLLEEKGTNAKSDQLLAGLSITCMLPNKGILYVGTNRGFVLTLPLPRLNGMPKFRQRPAISFQGHVGPVRFLASINCSLVETRALEVDRAPIGRGEGQRTPAGVAAGPSPSGDSDQKKDDDVSALAQVTSMSSSSPDLNKLKDNPVVSKMQQMNGLYESLLRGVLENSDDHAVLERIASTPFPHRRHRLHGAFKLAFGTTREAVVTPERPLDEQPPEVQKREVLRQRNLNMRHSASELLEPSTMMINGDDLSPLPVTRQVATSSAAEEKEKDEAFVPRDDPGLTEGTDRKPVQLNKSISSVSDVPSYKSTGQVSGGSFSTSTRLLSIPSSTAMISSTLATTPKSRAIVFVSAGRGYVPWNSPHKTDVSPEKPCLLLWMC